MSVDGEWTKMGAEITDDMLDEFAVTSTYDGIVGKIKERHGVYASSVGFSIPTPNSDEEQRLKYMLAELQRS